MIGSIEHPLFSFGLPPNAVAWLAFILGCALLFLRQKKWPKTSLALALLCATAALLSLGYFHYFLGGSPRVIDATAYLLEARTLANGSFSFESVGPTASLRGRFLIHTALDPTRLAPIFPPGYPALLAVGVATGLTFLIGPLLSAALVWVTYRLAFRLTGRERDGLVAACLSVLCAALRYHTAETMSHGFSALLAASAVLSTVELRRTDGRFGHALLLGLFLGVLCATRQLTGLILALACFAALLSLKKRRLLRLLPAAALGLLPGLGLLLLHHQAITGDFFVSPQSRYYDLADGPGNCFRLGLGSGCHYEHKDVVQEQGGDGLTLLWMLKNTLHRLHYHLLDVANFEPLVLLALVYAYRVHRRPKFLPLLLALVLVPLGYSLFYFAGSYPGGGARFFSEMLPLWHVLLALALRAFRWTSVGLFACLLGFAVHGVFAHIQLNAPHFGPPGKPALHLQRELPSDALTSSTIGKPLILVSTAHEFNLAHLSNPDFLVARRTFDDRERLLAQATGASRVFAYRTQPDGPVMEELFFSKAAPVPLLWEAEFDYPPEAAHGVWVHPEHLGASCVSRGRALRVHPEPHAQRTELILEGRGAPIGEFRVELGIVENSTHCRRVELGVQKLPGTFVIPRRILSNLSHIDTVVLTPTHH